MVAMLFKRRPHAPCNFRLGDVVPCRGYLPPLGGIPAGESSLSGPTFPDSPRRSISAESTRSLSSTVRLRLQHMLERFERMYLSHRLKACGGRVGDTAHWRRAHNAVQQDEVLRHAEGGFSELMLPRRGRSAAGTAASAPCGSPNFRSLRGALVGPTCLALVVLAGCTGSIAHLHPFDGMRPVHCARSDAAEALELRYLGAGGVLMRWNGHAIMTAPFY